MADQTTLGTAEAFVAARRACTGFTNYPGELPATLADAYAVQAEATSLWGEPIAGWKVSRISGDQEQIHAENPFVGPIFQGSVWPIVTTESASFPVIADGSAALEAERGCQGNFPRAH